jgi:nitrogen regulatory protein PII
MKLVLAYIQPHRLDAVRRGLEHLPHFPGMTVTAAQGFGREKTEEAAPRDASEALTDFTEAVRIETVVHDEQVDDVLVAIMNAAHTGQRGDGKVFVLPVERALRIKTMAEGSAAV